MSTAFSYTISTEIPASYIERLFDFIYRQYLLPQKQRFTNFYREKTEGALFLSYVVLDAQGKQLLKVEVKGTVPIDVKLIPID